MAINKYHFVFAYTTGLPGQKTEGEAGQFSSMMKNDSNVNKITEEEDKIVAELNAITNLNICNCYIKLKDGRKAMEYAKKSLKLRPRYWKANLRLAESFMLLADLDQAKTYLNIAEELQGGTEKYVKNKMKQLDKLYRIEEKKQRKLYKNMFKKN